MTQAKIMKSWSLWLRPSYVKTENGNVKMYQQAKWKQAHYYNHSPLTAQNIFPLCSLCNWRCALHCGYALLTAFFTLHVGSNCMVKAVHWVLSRLLWFSFCRNLQACISSLSNATQLGWLPEPTVAPPPTTWLPHTSACNQSLAKPPTVLNYTAIHSDKYLRLSHADFWWKSCGFHTGLEVQ